MPYTKKLWQDRIKDAQGNVIQEGTPVNAGNMNRIEQGIADAQTFLASDLAKAAVPSGVLDTPSIKDGYTSALSQIAPGQVQTPGSGWYTKGANALAVPGDVNHNFLINGNVVTFNKNSASFVPFTDVGASLHKLQLSPPPTSGERFDLVFLEAWRDQTDQSWKCRFRVADGVDFEKFQDGLELTSGSQYNTKVTAQGGNNAPIDVSSYSIDTLFTKRMYWGFLGIRKSSSSWNYPGIATQNDAGLFVCGDGTDASKAALKTYDGYVYAIPLFRVRRRNTGTYSAVNPTGASQCEQSPVTVSDTDPNASNWNGYYNFSPGERTIITFTAPLPASFTPGKILTRVTGTAIVGKIISRISDTQLLVEAIWPGKSAVNGHNFYVNSERPDGLYSNVIAERDIMDLRHKVSLTGWDYDPLAVEAFEKLLSTELQTNHRKRMVKTYHGIRKTPIDSNHVFYASFDGTTVAELGGDLGISSPAYLPMPTGIGIKASGVPVVNIANLTEEQGTIDCFIDADKTNDFTGTAGDIVALYNSNNHLALRASIAGGDNRVYLLTYKTEGAAPTNQLSAYPLKNKGLVHLRYTWNKAANLIAAYVNGVLIASAPYSGMLAPSKIALFAGGWTSTGSDIMRFYPFKGPISDLSVSNIDRGTSFATIPADVMSGNARIMPAFNNQRKVHSDALVSQLTQQIAKVQNQTQEKGVIISKGTGTNTGAWEAGDKVKITGRAGETITGVIDSDTALAKVMETINNVTNTGTIKVDDVSKFAVNDTFRMLLPDGVTYSSFTYTVTAIDAVNKTITVSFSGTTTFSAGATLFETTASTSSPTVKANINGTVTTVPGTWTGLGTNAAEFTLGTLPANLVAQDILVEYSLNMPAGQGGLSEVYTDTLAGEFKGQKLIKGTLAIIDDFKDKVAGSTAVNPNIMKTAYNTSIQAPSAFGTEATQAQYDTVKNLDNNLLSLSTSANGQIPQVLLSFDLVGIAEKKYGSDFFKGCLTVAEKVQRLKDRIGTLSPIVWSFGSTVGGNKVYLTWYYPNSSSWATDGGRFSHSNGMISRTAMSSNSVSSLIDANGYAHILVYTDASDGVTPSVINIDTASIEISLISKAGYDLLVPENPRRDAGLSNTFYVRKETKEIEALVPTDENGGVITWGDFVPYQGIYTGASINLKPVTSPAKNNFATSYGTGRQKPGVTMESSPVPLLSILPIGVNVNQHDYVNDDLNTQGAVASNINGLLKRGGLYHEEYNHATAQNYRQIKVGSLTFLGTSLAKRGAASINGYNYGVITSVPNSLAKVIYGSMFLAINTDSRELQLVIMTMDKPAMSVDGDPRAAVDVFRLPGRPLAAKGA
ncbi:LamG-like jellyroll fold domain-containing protein [Fictibacillus gelatini]|uniref:LamG-like jellyroll fold domain-containing protein n=1 Tax=Fictibacillus gelatini TaxID=225985 RepID=UPI000423D677|nr:LamG-like jellyroll fold domain-containing protein [Fictibacillus gelatini]